MPYTRFSALAALMFMAGLAHAEVRVDGAVEYGTFASPQHDFKPGERILARSSQQIERTEVIPAKLGTKFGVRYNLVGKRADEAPLMLFYLTPGVVTPDGLRHDKFELMQKLAPGAAQEVMAFEFTEIHEVVPGEWRFMVFQGDRKLLEQRFDVR
jgi:hypothetical protein